MIYTVMYLLFLKLHGNEVFNCSPSVHVGATLGVHLSVERLVMGTSNVSGTTLWVQWLFGMSVTQEVHIDHFVKMYP